MKISHNYILNDKQISLSNKYDKRHGKASKKRKRRKDYSLTIENMKGCNEKRKGEKKNG